MTTTQSANGVATQGVMETRNARVYYGSYLAVDDVSMTIEPKRVTAFIGPSGCGKSTLLRCFNRMNDLIPSARVTGEVLYHGQNLYDDTIDPVEVRRRVGMVFQKPNPFPKSVFDNIAFGPRINGYKGDKNDLADLVEQSLKQAALWDEVKDKLDASGLALSGGQQQRLCIARALAVKPEVVLMDEPCASLDPISTRRIEELIDELKQYYTIIIVTHNMQQAARVSDNTAFFNAEVDEKGVRVGRLVEFDATEVIFNTPVRTETKAYVSGHFG
ncbi:MAG: phosphate ABC transporter ATP-binding protein PstB [Cyanobacteria bacterium J06639_1]